MSAERNKDGRLAIRLLSQNLEGYNATDELNAKNKLGILLLRYDGETREWGIVKYINAPQDASPCTGDLHGDHGFKYFEDQER